MVVAITRSDLLADALRLVARWSKDSCQAPRLLALAQVLDGHPRGEAARAGGMDRQTLRDWVHRYNAQGVEGLCDRRLSEAQLAELASLVEAGPDPAVHGVVRWRCIDLQGQIAARFGVEISERQVGRILKRLDFTRLSVRPRHPKTDEAAQQAFKKLRRHSQGRATGPGPRPAAGNLVSGRSADRPEGYADPDLGADRFAATRPSRHAL